MELPQYMQMASAEEASLIQRLLVVKDEILKLIPAFREEAEALRAKLHRHDTRFLDGDATLTQKERQAIELRFHENLTAAETFAKKWKLPWTPNADVDPSYLIECPHAGAPVIHGTLAAVEEIGEEFLPILVVAMDIRFPKTLLRERIQRRIEEAQETWRARGALMARVMTTDVSKYERMLRVWRLRERGADYESVADDVGVTPRQVRNLEKEMRSILRKREYWKIAPYSHLAWARVRQQAEADRHVSVSAMGKPVRVRPLL